MTYNFAGGVRDPDGRRGFITIGPGEVTAIDLSAGSILWRRGAVGRPIAATDSRLLLLDHEDGRFIIRLLDAGTGADSGIVRDFGMPDWAVTTGTAPDAVLIEASAIPASDDVRISWRLRRLYRGGAPPPAHIQAQSSDEQVGSIVIDPDHAQARPDPGLMSPPVGFAAESERSAGRDLGPHAIPRAMTAARLGRRRMKGPRMCRSAIYSG